MVVDWIRTSSSGEAPTSAPKPAKTEVPKTKATPVPFDDGGEPASGDFDFGDGE
jgi:hypothetical protein